MHLIPREVAPPILPARRIKAVSTWMRGSITDRGVNSACYRGFETALPGGQLVFVLLNHELCGTKSPTVLVLSTWSRQLCAILGLDVGGSPYEVPWPGQNGDAGIVKTVRIAGQQDQRGIVR